MDANELIERAFGRLGFGPESDRNQPEPAFVREFPDGTTAVLTALVNNEPAGYPRAGERCQIETYDSDNEFTGRAEFPDPVSAYSFVRFVSGWVDQPPETEIVPEPENPYGTTPR